MFVGLQKFLYCLCTCIYIYESTPLFSTWSKMYLGYVLCRIRWNNCYSSSELYSSPELFSSHELNSFSPEPLPRPSDATLWRLLHFPDDDFGSLVNSALIGACLFCLYTSITAQWFTYVINKTKHRVDLLKFIKRRPDVPIVFLASKLEC